MSAIFNQKLFSKTLYGNLGEDVSFIERTKAIFGSSLKVFIDPRAVESTLVTDQIDDLSGNNNHGAITAGNSSYTTYNGQRVLHLQNACITWPDSDDFDHSETGLFTLGFFVNNSIASAYNAFMSKYSQAPGNREWALFHASASQGIELTNAPNGGSPSGLNRDISMVNGEGKVMGIRAAAGVDGLQEALWDGSVSKLAKNVTLFQGNASFRVGGWGSNVAADMYVGPLVYVKGYPSQSQIDAWASLVAAEYSEVWAKVKETCILPSASQSNMSLMDSMIAPWADDGRIAFEAQAAVEGYKWVEWIDSSTSGFPLLVQNSSPPSTFGYVNNNGTAGPAFTNYYNGNLTSAVNGKSIWGDMAKVKYVVVHHCEGDVTDSKADIKQGMLDEMDLLVAQHGADTICIVECNPTYKIAVTDEQFQDVIEARMEAAEEHPNGYLAHETRQLALQDTQHIGPAGNTVRGQLFAKQCAYLDRLRSTPPKHPEVTGVLYEGDTDQVIVSFDSGTLSGTETGDFRITVDGTPVAVSSMVIDNIAKTVTLTMASTISTGSAVLFWIGYGRGASLTPANIIVNEEGLPFRRVYGLSVGLLN